MALVLSRKSGERVVVGDNLVVVVNRIQGDRVSLSFEAPREVQIRRDELLTDAERARLLPFPRRDEGESGRHYGKTGS